MLDLAFSSAILLWIFENALQDSASFEYETEEVKGTSMLRKVRTDWLFRTLEACPVQPPLCHWMRAILQITSCNCACRASRCIMALCHWMRVILQMMHCNFACRASQCMMLQDFERGWRCRCSS